MQNVKPKIEFRPTKMQSGVGWSIQVLKAGHPPYQLGGFKTEAEAVDWVQRKSATWLKDNPDGRRA